MADTISVRAATMEDYDAICVLLRQVDRYHADLLPRFMQPVPGDPRPAANIAAYVEADDGDYLLAETDGAVVGFVNIKRTVSPNYPMFRPLEFALIENIVVDEAHRTSGIGSVLMDAAENWARERELGFIQLAVWAANSAAVAFYEKRGFEPLLSRMWLDLS